jgi:hypothetical protein
MRHLTAGAFSLLLGARWSAMTSGSTASLAGVWGTAERVYAAGRHGTLLFHPTPGR